MRKTMVTLAALLTAATGAWGGGNLQVALPASAEVKRIDGALVACGTRQSLSSWDNPKRGIGCARDFIAGFFREVAQPYPNDQVIIDPFEANGPRTANKPVHVENVYLFSEGSDPVLKNTVFIVSGHYDTRCSDVMDSSCDAPGADDDGSGSTVSMESAKLLAGMPHRATIIFATVCGEEQGLYGGKRLSDWVRDHGYRVGAMLNNDIVGATNGDSDRRVRLFCDTDEFSPARELGLWIDEFIGREDVRMVFRKDRFGRGGDHFPFLAENAPAVRFTEPREDYHHQHQNVRLENGIEYGDLQKFMDFDFLARVARVNAQTLIALANAPLPPAHVVVAGAVEPSATISFTAPEDKGRQHFEILSRDTTTPRWNVLREVAAPGNYTLTNIPIDNRFFAVRSVASNGTVSLAVDAQPATHPAGPEHVPGR